MSTVIHRTDWSITSGTTKSITIPAVAAGNKLIITSNGESVVTAKITNSSGTAFNKRTTYGGGNYDVSISDFAAVGGETAVFITLGGAGRNGGTILEVPGSLTFTSASNNGAGAATITATQDWQAGVTTAGAVSANSLLVSTCAHDTGATVGAPTQFGPLGSIQSSGIVGATVAWATGIADITPGLSYPENLSAGSYKATFGLPAPVQVGHMFVAQAIYTDSSGTATVTQANPIAGENTLPGTANGNWYGGTTTTATIAGYCDKASYSPGDTVNFKVDSSGAAFRVEVYRIGWYGGEFMGARNVVGYQSYITGTPTTQSAPTVDSTLGSASCAWTTNATYTIPSTAAPGVYQVLYRRTDTGHTGDYWVGVFIVKASSNTGKVAVIMGDSTWQAYNDWGSTTNSTAGRNLYEISTSTSNNATRAYAVCFDRPYRTWANHSNTWLFDSELAYVMSLEQFGYNAVYYSCIDMENNTSLLNGAQLVMPIGHHEYWSQGMYDCLTNARGAGVNMHFVSSNTALWHTRFAAADTNKRTMICYKDSLTVDVTAGWTGTGRDPVSYTGTWRDSRTSTPNNTDIRRENSLTGQLFGANASITQKMTVPFASKGVPIWRNSAAVQALTSGGTYTTVQNTLGNEMDWADGSSGQPSNQTAAIAPTTMTMSSQGVNANGSIYTLSTPTSATVSPTLYRHSAGALVYNTGSWRGWWGINRWSNGAYASAATLDLALQNAFLAIMYDLGVAPATLNKAITSDTAPTNPATGAPTPGNSTVATAYGLSSGSTGSAAFGAGTTLSASGTVATSGAAGMTGGTALTGTGTPAIGQAATVTAGATLTATGAPAVTQLAAVTAGAALTTTGQPAPVGTAAVSAGATLTTTGTPVTTAASGMAPGATLAATGTAADAGAAALALGTTLNAAGTPADNGTAAFTTGTSLTVTGNAGSTSPAAFASGAALTAAGQPALGQQPMLTAGVTVAGSGGPAFSQTTTMASGAALTAGGQPASGTSVAVTAGAALAATGSGSQPGAANTTTGAVLTVTATQATGGSTNLTASTTLTTGGTPAERGTATFTTSTTLSATGASSGASPAAFTAATTLATTGNPADAGQAGVAVGIALTTTGQPGAASPATSTASALLSVTGTAAGPQPAALTAAAIVTATGRPTPTGNPALTARAVLTASGNPADQLNPPTSGPIALAYATGPMSTFTVSTGPMSVAYATGPIQIQGEQ